MKRGGFLFFSIVSLLTAVAPVGMQAQEKKHENALQERQALPTTIMGTVIDSEANEPLPGATVRFKGTNVGVVTDNVTADGCAFSERYGFTRLHPSDHNSWIYEQAWPDFVKRVRE